MVFGRMLMNSPLLIQARVVKLTDLSALIKLGLSIVISHVFFYNAQEGGPLKPTLGCMNWCSWK